MSTDIERRIVELEALAQRAAEERLEHAHATLDEDPDPEWEAELAGPYCGCITCDVREILDAAYTHLREIAILEQAADIMPPLRDAGRVVDYVELDPNDRDSL